MIIDRARLETLRDRFRALQAEYLRASDDARAVAIETARAREALANFEEAHKHVKQPQAEVAGVSDETLRSHKWTSAQIGRLREHERLWVRSNAERANLTDRLKMLGERLADKRAAQDNLGARIRANASYMDNVERLAREHRA